MPQFRVIPSIDTLLARPALADAIEAHGRAAVTASTRRAAAALRARATAAPGDEAPWPADAEAAAAWIEQHVRADLADGLAASLRPVINATGVILHTNLGRAPIARAALDAAASVAAGYSNLEYDLAVGGRGHRHVHAEALLCRLTGAEAAIVANNNAAATMLVLAALAAGREVLVSRGELVEIGGGFRVPDVMTQSGAALREVGTTNRTRTADYAAAAGARTALVLRVHPSNFRIEGFTERPALADLTAAARRLDLPVFEDLGSGWLGLDDVPAPAVLRDEPSVRGSLSAGVDLVAFSGDKLLGGPQCGLVVGRRVLIDRVRRHPLMRAVRADKLTYAVLEATLALWARPASRGDIPTYRMLTASSADVETRARRLAAALAGVAGIAADVAPCDATVGGGSAPDSRMPSWCVRCQPADCSAASLEAALRGARPPVVARVEQDRVVMDCRTIGDDEIDDVVRAVSRRRTDAETTDRRA